MPNRPYRKILPAPTVLKRALLARIEREIKASSAASPGLIQFKMNALEDVDITRALYRASQAGVKVDLIVRDTCRLRPGIQGLSETVRVVSIVGRFLEHGRIYYFRNGGAEDYFIGSADCMKRNLESRVEVVAPVEDPQLRKELRTRARHPVAAESMPVGNAVGRHLRQERRRRCSARMPAGDDRFRRDAADRSDQGQEAPLQGFRPPRSTRKKRRVTRRAVEVAALNRRPQAHNSRIELQI